MKPSRRVITGRYRNAMSHEMINVHEKYSAESISINRFFVGGFIFTGF